jgi:hypothetical protein
MDAYSIKSATPARHRDYDHKCELPFDNTLLIELWTRAANHHRLMPGYWPRDPNWPYHIPQKQDSSTSSLQLHRTLSIGRSTRQATIIPGPNIQPKLFRRWVETNACPTAMTAVLRHLLLVVQAHSH